MQQTPSQRKFTLITFTTALLSCPAALYAASGLDTSTVIDIVAPQIAPADIPTRSYTATGPIVTPAFDPGITSKVGVTDEILGGDAVSYTFNFNTTDTVGPLPPGQHIITWTATDTGFNSTLATQTLNVLPTINFGPDQEVGEGGTAVVTAYLSGPAPSYPFTVNFNIDNTNNNGGGVDNGTNDHSLSGGTGSLTFASGETEKSVIINIYNDPDSTPNETIKLTLDTAGFPANTVWGAAATGQKIDHTITIIQPSTNHAPLAQLSASQGSQQTRAVTADGGAVTVTTSVYDADGDTISYDWSASDNAVVPLTGTTGSSFSFDPQELNPGFYTVRLTVSDGKGGTSSQDMLLALLSTTPTFSASLDQDGDGSSDASEGLIDSDNDGIPDYLDANANPSLMQGFASYTFDPDLKQSGTLSNNNITLTWDVSGAASNLILYPLMIAVEPGLQLNLGPTAFAANKSHARLSTAQAETLRNATLADGLVSSDGQVLDIEISGLDQAGDSADVIIPQTAGIPPSQSGSPVFQVFTSAKQWAELDTTGADTIATDTKKTDSYCPDLADMAAAPGTLYQNTLAAGDECLLLSVEDGGPNDYDGVANGSIRLMGGVFISTNSIPETTTTGGTFTGSSSSSSETLGKLDLGTGGGGILYLPGLLLLVPAVLLRRRQ